MDSSSSAFEEHVSDLKNIEGKTLPQRPDHSGMFTRVSERTIELARIAGRAPHQIRQSDYERAKREIRS